MALQDISDRLRAAERAAGRSEGDVSLIAVSKVQPPERVLAVLEQGHRVFGENYVQEAAGKWPAWREQFKRIKLHMIGPLQTNKAKVAVDLFDAIHTLNRPSLAQKLASLNNLMGQADQQLESLKDPANYQALDAFLELWTSTVIMATNLAESPRGPRTYVTPKQMSVNDIASAPEVYGSSERAAEIMMNNNLDDPFAVPAGTKIVFFVDAGLAA